jgi:hypothetical protein
MSPATESVGVINALLDSFSPRGLWQSERDHSPGTDIHTSPAKLNTHRPCWDGSSRAVRADRARLGKLDSP